MTEEKFQEKRRTRDTITYRTLGFYLPEEAALKRRDQRRQARKAHQKSDMIGHLNINSLMDAMVILLIFLLISITSDPLHIKQDKALKLAMSKAPKLPEPSIPIRVTKEQIIVDNEQVIRLNRVKRNPGCVDKQDYLCPSYYSIDKLDTGGDERRATIDKLQTKLTELVARQKEEDIKLAREWRGVATIIADAEIPYKVITKILYTAGQAELSHFNFAVVRTGSVAK